MSAPETFMFVFVLLKLWESIPLTNANGITLSKVYPNIRSRVIYEKTVDNVPAVSVVACACFCTGRFSCVGFSFNGNRTCQLRSNPPGEGLDNLRSIFYKNVRCDNAPDVAKTTKKTDGHYPGDVTTYTCKRGYTPCGNEMTSVCQSTGQWEYLTGQCERSIWVNPPTYGKKDFDVTLPCGTTTKFKLTILVTPVIKDQYAVNLMRGLDIIFHLAFKLDTGSIVFNTLIDDTWMTQEVFHLNVALNKKSRIIISLHNRNAKVLIGDDFDHEYVCQTSDPRVEHVQIHNREFVQISKLEIIDK